LDEYPSKLLQEAIEQFSSLPGIGRRTALRLALFILKQEPSKVKQFGNAFIKLRNEVIYCNTCYNISDTDHCSICAHPGRNKEIICVVEDVRDVMAIENTGQYKGVYHVLGGIISPMEGIGPDDVRIKELVERVKNEKTSEIIMALSTTMEGDTTNYFIFKKLKELNLKITTIARGVAVGDELEYTDEQTLGRSLMNRVLYVNTLAN
tara:strand:- start:436 stop:1056 length:621 start_codon:yes stop_codon:yes gene_type:complete